MSSYEQTHDVQRLQEVLAAFRQEIANRRAMGADWPVFPYAGDVGEYGVWSAELQDFLAAYVNYKHSTGMSGCESAVDDMSPALNANGPRAVTGCLNALVTLFDTSAMDNLNVAREEWTATGCPSLPGTIPAEGQPQTDQNIVATPGGMNAIVAGLLFAVSTAVAVAAS